MKLLEKFNAWFEKHESAFKLALMLIVLTSVSASGKVEGVEIPFLIITGLGVLATPFLVKKAGEEFRQ